MKKLVNIFFGLSSSSRLARIFRRVHLFTFLFFCLSVASAKNYYVSSSTGNDSYTTTQAQSMATPWKSLSKVNAIFASLLPGDSILFKRGDVFYGTLNAAASGTALKQIVIGAYGSGAKPLLSGLVSISGWTNMGGGVWQTTASSCKSTLNLVTLNNKAQAIGRYPNANAANGGYLNYETFNGTVSITDNELLASPNWTGADVVIRKARWILDVCAISNHSGTTISYTNPSTSTFTGKNNFGYFIQNDPRTLDQLGEWYFNKSTKVLQMYFGANDPANYKINASVVDTVLNLGAKSFITVDNIAVEGGNVFGILAKDGSNVTIQNCSISNIGDFGIFIWNVPRVLIENNSITESLSNGIYVYNTIALNSIVRGNILRNIGLMGGMGESGNETYNGLWITGDSALVEYNDLDSIGYIGVNYRGSNGIVKNNSINHFCSVKDDGGGIYIMGGSNPSAYINRKITGNIISNAIGAPYGTQRATVSEDARGIYLDLAAMNVEISGNSISNCVGSGLFLSNSTNVAVTKNTIFNSKNAISFQRFPGLAQVRNNAVKGNIFFPLEQTQPNFFYWNGELNNPVVTDIQTDMRAIATFDSNYYRNDVVAPFDYYYHLTNNGTFVDPISLNLPQWKSFINSDVNSKAVANKVSAYKLNGIVGSNTILNPKFETNISNITVSSSNNNHIASWDNSSKISGVGTLKIAPGSSTSTYTVVAASAGGIVAGKTYLLKFSTLGTTINGFLKVSLRQTLTPYATLFAYQYGYFGNTIQQNEFLFSPTVSESNVTYLIEIIQSSGTTYIDNIELTEVKATLLTPASQVRYDYNETKINKSVALDAAYFDVSGIRYTGSILLAPYTSMVLIKDTTSVSAPLVATSSATAINCNGGTSTVTVSATGGTSPYTGTGSFVVTAGTYTYTVRDASGATATTSITVSQPTALVVSATAPAITVNGGSTTVTVGATGGTSPYTGTGSFVVTAGTYTYTVTDAKGCVGTKSITITQPAALVATSTSTAINCNGGISTVTVSATGGTSPYTGTGSFVVTAGTYTYTVRDASGATATTSITVSQPTALVVSATAPAITVNGGSTTVTVGATGGTSPYTGTGSFVVTAGTYTYSVTDVKGCVGKKSITITQPDILTDTVTGGVISCYNGTGIAKVIARGGIRPYTDTGYYTVSAGKACLKLSFNAPIANNYTLNYWSIGATSSLKRYMLKFSTLGTTSTGNIRAYLRQTDSPYTNLTPYQFVNFGTSRIDHSILFVNPASAVNASFVIGVNQSSGSTYIDNVAFFEVDASGKIISNNLYSVGHFESNISNIFTWSPTNNHISTWDTTRKISRTYYFRVTDSVGSTATAIFNTAQPTSPLVATASAPIISSSGGSTTVTVAASGGVAPYSGVGNFVVLAGTYTYKVTDAAGCSTSITITIAPYKAPAAPISTNTPLLRLTIFPNPAEKEFNMSARGEGVSTFDFIVMSSDGKIVYKGRGNLNSITKFGSNLAQGLYNVRLFHKGKIYNVKLVKGG